MTRRGSWEPIAAALSALVAVAACVWVWLDVIEPPRTVIPGYAGQPFAQLSAEMPNIAPFESFNALEDNPFVPWRERQIEKDRIKTPNRVIFTPPAPPTEIKVVPPPVLKLPPPTAGGGDAPRVLGYQGKSASDISAVVQLKGEARARVMKPGETVGRWTFIGIESGNVGVFRDQLGHEYRLVIGTQGR